MPARNIEIDFASRQGVFDIDGYVVEFAFDYEIIRHSKETISMDDRCWTLSHAYDEIDAVLTKKDVFDRDEQLVDMDFDPLIYQVIDQAFDQHQRRPIGD